MKNKNILKTIGNELTDENYHRLAQVFFCYADRKDVEEITFNEFLVWFKKHWGEVLT